MKHWLCIAAAAPIAFVLGALFGRQYLTHPTPHELQLMHIASAERELTWLRRSTKFCRFSKILGLTLPRMFAAANSLGTTRRLQAPTIPMRPDSADIF
jgi:hypothetical protein